MSDESFSVDYLLDLAQYARSLPEHDPAATEAHSPARFAVEAEQAAAAIQRGDWRAASNHHYGLFGAIGDAAAFLNIDLDPTKSIETRVDLVEALDRADVRQQWLDLPTPTAIHADTERITIDFVDGSRVESWLADAHDPVSTLMNWIWDRYGVDAVYDALAELLVRPGDNSKSHSRTEPLT